MPQDVPSPKGNKWRQVNERQKPRDVVKDAAAGGLQKKAAEMQHDIQKGIERIGSKEKAKIEDDKYSEIDLMNEKFDEFIQKESKSLNARIIEGIADRRDSINKAFLREKDKFTKFRKDYDQKIQDIEVLVKEGSYKDETYITIMHRHMLYSIDSLIKERTTLHNQMMQANTKYTTELAKLFNETKTHRSHG